MDFLVHFQSGFLSCLPVFSFIIFGGCLLETCSFLKGEGWGVPKKRRGEEGKKSCLELGGVEGRKLRWGCIVGEKSIFLIKISLK